jgi:hypothetical protein
LAGVTTTALAWCSIAPSIVAPITPSFTSGKQYAGPPSSEPSGAWPASAARTSTIHAGGPSRSLVGGAAVRISPRRWISAAGRSWRARQVVPVAVQATKNRARRCPHGH